MFVWKFSEIHTLLRRSRRPPPPIENLHQRSSVLGALCKASPRMLFTCENPIKRYTIPYAKTIYFGLCTPRFHSKVKVSNLWIFLLPHVLPFIRGPLWVSVLMRTFFVRSGLHECSARSWYNVRARNEFSNSCTISVQELPVSNHFINDFDLSNGSRQRWIVHRRTGFMPSDTINFAWKFLHNLSSSSSSSDEKGTISSAMIMCAVCNTKVSDNYPGQGHEIISFFIAHSQAIHHSR